MHVWSHALLVPHVNVPQVYHLACVEPRLNDVRSLQQQREVMGDGLKVTDTNELGCNGGFGIACVCLCVFFGFRFRQTLGPVLLARVACI